MSDADEIEILQKMAAKAHAFVAEHGTPLDRIRAEVLVRSATPESLLAELAVAQREDGAFCFEDVAEFDPSAGTLHALSILAAASLLRSEPVERAVLWLGEGQAADGSWSIAGGDAHGVHLVTGFLAGFLARSPFARAHVLDRVGDWLAVRWSPDLVRGGDFAMIAAYAQFFANAPHEAGDPILQWCGRELERGVRGGQLPALFALRVFALCDAPVFPGARLRAGALLDPLADEQSADGGWLPELPIRWRLAASLEGLGAWRRFGKGAPFAGAA